MAGARARSIACATVHTWGHQTICSKLHVNSAGWPPRVACGGVRVGWERDTPLTRPQEPLATRNVPILECTDFIGISTKRAILDKSSGNPKEGAALAHGPRSWSSLWLQPVQIIGGLLRMAGGGENRPLVALQHGEPALNICSVVVAGFGRNPKIGTDPCHRHHVAGGEVLEHF